MCVATIFIRTSGMQLLAKNSSVKEAPIETEVIGMQSSLGLITSHLACNDYDPILRTGNEVTYIVIMHGSTDSRQRTIRVRMFPLLKVLQH